MVIVTNTPFDTDNRFRNAIEYDQAGDIISNTPDAPVTFKQLALFGFFVIGMASVAIWLWKKKK
jgi:hypothetical protein